MRILLVEDDETIAIPLTDGLVRYGFTVDHVSTGARALAHRGAELVLLDLGLPDLDGIDVCRGLQASAQVPVIMLTARSSETDRVVGLELGADDYVTKPFSLRELVARIRAVARRTATMPPAAAGESPDPARPVVVGSIAIDPRTREVRVGGRPVALAPKEFDLLALLAEDPGAVRTRQEILDTVWDPHFYGSTKTLDFHVAALRRKLGDPACVQTVRGVGFRLAEPSHRGPG